MQLSRQKGATPPGRVDRRRARARAEIVEIAREILATGGVAAFSLDDVARELGTTKPAVYHYFESKEALVRAAMLEGFLEHARVVTEAAKRAPAGRAVLEATTRAFVEHYAGRLGHFRLDFAWTQIHPNPDATREIALARMNELTDLVEEKLRADSSLSSERARRLCVTSWITGFGLLSALSLTDAQGTSLAHSTDALLRELVRMVRSAVP
jgi:AcrR family transcriptional regulator